ncbi:uncharacterized protein P884DRAFT_273563 [Thermothelomyces heterothallicus CBS 202.75]|uniref:uncharacterized protein n=1 Tax=Thermothelomyces heterothallicus CBS 202.75 TaxID=1149848 RepID=UPI0037439E08
MFKLADLDKYEERSRFNEDLLANHPTNLDAPNNLRELTDTICQFLEKNNLAKPYEFKDPNIRNDPLPDLEERRAEIGSDMSETELQESFMEGIIKGATEMEERSRWSGDNLFNLVSKKAVEILGDATFTTAAGNTESSQMMPLTAPTPPSHFTTPDSCPRGSGSSGGSFQVGRVPVPAGMETPTRAPRVRQQRDDEAIASALQAGVSMDEIQGNLDHADEDTDSSDGEASQDSSDMPLHRYFLPDG